MQLTLEAITFNHDPASATCDAFNIRRNETELVETPEWRWGVSINPEDSPAAYARDELNGKTITIKVRFKFLDFDPIVKSVRIRALDGRLHPRLKSNGLTKFFFELLYFPIRGALPSNVLGSVAEQEVNVQSGNEFELSLIDTHITGVGVDDIVWRWQFRTDTTDWADFAITTHRIYTTLALPSGPWRPGHAPSNTQVPWSEVLGYACRWADSAADEDEAASLITRAVNNLGGRFVKYQGSPSSYARENFDCSSFLQLLRGANNPQTVNCYDCATIVSTFANILGCQLSQSRMGAVIHTNPIQLIGRDDWVTPTFKEHEVAWEEQGRDKDELYDACLKVDGDDIPSQVPPQIPLLPTNIPFGGEHQYRFRLTSGNCFPFGDLKRRPLGPNPPGTRPSVTDEELAFLKEHYDFNDWGDPLATGASSIQSMLAPSAIYFDGWKLERWRESGPENPLYSFEMLWRPADPSTGILVRIEVFTCASASDVKHLLLSLLREFHMLNVDRLATPLFGDTMFVESGEVAVLFAKSLQVALVQSVGRNSLSAMNIAAQLAPFL